MKIQIMLIIIVLVVTSFTGCIYATKDLHSNGIGIRGFHAAVRNAFLMECKKVANGEKYHNDEGWRYDAHFEILYLDDKYLSFRENTWLDSGEYVHGGTSLIVGTIDRTTGSVLKAEDIIPSSRRLAVLAALRNGIVKKIGEDNILNEPTLSDNCYLAEDGIHFVYNEYEVAPFSIGTIELVIRVPMDVSTPITIVSVTTMSALD